MNNLNYDYVPSILFVIHKIQNCGVYQYGKRVYDILKKDSRINYILAEIDSYSEYKNYLTLQFSAIIYNYHAYKLPTISRYWWLIAFLTVFNSYMLLIKVRMVADKLCC